MADQRAFFYLVGVGVTHSIAPVVHNYIAQKLGYNWQFIAQECETVEDAMKLFRLPTFAGGVVTMPYKTSVIKYLDGLDDHCVKIGACNNVYRAADGTLRGTNTDWCGIKGSLEGATADGKGKPALIVGAGGASRAAIYALHDHLNCNPIYILNRDQAEVDALFRDTQQHYGSNLSLIHLSSVAQAQQVNQPPFYIVGCVPDFEPQTPAELTTRSILTHFLQSAPKGVLLDICFKPRRTRTLKLAESHGWKTVEGITMIGYQTDEQYRVWCSEEESKLIPQEEVWGVLRKAADESPRINF